MNPNEVFDTNYDYQAAAERKHAPNNDDLRLLGRVAQLFTETQEGAKKVQDRFDAAVNWWKTKTGVGRAYTKHRQELAHKGSLADISGAIIPHEEAYEPAPVHPPYEVGIGDTPPAATVVPEIEPAQPLTTDNLNDPNHMQPQRVRSQKGLYRSIHAMRTAEGAGSIDDEMAELMKGAVRRARQQIANDNTAQTTTIQRIREDDDHRLANTKQ